MVVRTRFAAMSYDNSPSKPYKHYIFAAMRTVDERHHCYRPLNEYTCPSRAGPRIRPIVSLIIFARTGKTHISWAVDNSSVPCLSCRVQGPGGAPTTQHVKRCFHFAPRRLFNNRPSPGLEKHSPHTHTHAHSLPVRPLCYPTPCD
jgi:hypothetical protein